MLRNSQRGFSVINATLAVALATAGTAGALVYNAGAIRVKVQQEGERGENINLIIPAAIVPVALAFVPDEHLQEASAHMREALPILRAAGQALEAAPDFVLVEVRERDEHVLVEKRGGSLHVTVNSSHENVEVSFPIGVIISAANRIAAVPLAAPREKESDSGDELDEAL